MRHEDLFDSGLVPTPDILPGVWEVNVLSGKMPGLRRYGHVKIIRRKGDTLRGYNRVLGILRLGRFRISYSPKCAWFHYGGWHFFDKVKKLNKNWLIGKYFIMGDFGTPEEYGYFEMRRKEKNGKRH